MTTIRIQNRRGTSSQWSLEDPTLNAGEIGVETDTGKFKIGDGTTTWETLAYAATRPSDLSNTVDEYVEIADVGTAGSPPTLDVNKNLIVPGASIIVEGTTDNGFETTLTVTDPTEDRTITFPNNTGTVALTGDIPGIIQGHVAAGNGIITLLNNSTGKYDIFNDGVISLAGTSNQIAVTDDNAGGYTAAFTNNVTMPNNLTVTGTTTLSGAPTEALHAATKAYVDNTAAGLNFHAPVSAATTANLSATYSNGTSGVGATLTNSGSNEALSIDAYALSLNQRVLVKDQTTGSQNGLYYVSTVGDESTPWVLTRATDADNSPAGEIAYGDFCFIQNGGQAGFGFIVNTSGTITIGTTSIAYVQFNAGQVVVAGNGLSEATPGTLSINTGVTADLSTSQTLTNKSINLANNTLTGTIAEFNTAVSDGNFATLIGAETIQNKTISGSNNTITDIANGSLVNDSITIGATPVTLGGSITTLSDFTSIASTAFTGDLNGDVNGNATSATTLETARNIAGQSFDGSANISIAPTDLTGVMASAEEINILDGATLSTTELNYVDGVTSSIQTQLDAKAATSDVAELAQDAVGTILGSGLSYNDSVPGIGVNSGEMINKVMDAVSGNSYGLIGNSTYLDVINTNGYHKEIELDIEAVESKLNTDGYLTTSSTSTLTNKTLTSPKINEDVALTATATELNYVDGVTSAIQTQLNDKLALSGGTLTGALTLHADPGSALHAATKQYVDNTASGIVAKPQVLGATTANLDATYNNGTAGVGATLTHNSNGEFPSGAGGASGWAVGKGILVKNQTNKEENGRYYVSDMGSVSTPYVLTRCSYCDEASEIPGAYIFVQDGTFSGTGWIQVVADPATFVVGTDDIDVYQFSGSGAITAGTGITLNGNEVSINTATTADLSTAQTLTNKTLTSPKINEDVAVTATATELNVLDGITSSTAELNILDGVTSTALELNVLDGITSTTAELNILDGVTSTAAEINILDGATLSTTELNYVDGVTSAIQTQIDTKEPSKYSFISVTGTSRTLSSSTDKYKMLNCTNGSAVTITVPTDSADSSWAIGDYVDISQLGGGQISFSYSGVSLRSAGNQYKTRVQYSSVTLVKIASNEWLLTGDTVA